MKTAYDIQVAGLHRSLPLFKVNDSLSIAAFIIFGDVELTERCAAELLKKLPPHDVMITAEAKSIPLIHELARQSGENQYIIARKAMKVYMRDVVSVSVKSITTQNVQTLYLGGDDAELMRGRRVLIVDDVISTGESLSALEKLVTKAGGNICGKAAILAEGDAAERGDIIFLEKLPLFDSEGNAL